MQSVALQQTPPPQAVPLQLTVQLAPPQVTCPGHAPSAQLTCVSFSAILSTEFWQEGWPLHSTRHELLAPPHVTLPGQLPAPLQRKSQRSASQRSSLVHAPFPSQRTSHELPPQLTWLAQLLAPMHCTLQLSASLHSTPLEQALLPVHATEHGTPAGHFTVSLQGCASSHVITHNAA
jgi:hypothetical protein